MCLWTMQNIYLCDVFVILGAPLWIPRGMTLRQETLSRRLRLDPALGIRPKRGIDRYTRDRRRAESWRAPWQRSWRPARRSPPGEASHIRFPGIIGVLVSGFGRNIDGDSSFTWAIYLPQMHTHARHPSQETVKNTWWFPAMWFLSFLAFYFLVVNFPNLIH